MPTPHPVAALLSDEMKARVRAVTFIHTSDGIATPGTDCRCPFAVALAWGGPGWPDEHEIASAIGVTGPVMIGQIRELIADFDEGFVAPTDVYALLDCLPDDATRSPVSSTEVAP